MFDEEKILLDIKKNQPIFADLTLAFEKASLILDDVASLLRNQYQHLDDEKKTAFFRHEICQLLAFFLFKYFHNLDEINEHAEYIRSLAIGLQLEYDKKPAYEKETY